MTLNTTLFVQIINFGIAYIAVYFLLLKPALLCKAKDEHLRNILQTTVEKSQKEVSVLCEEKEHIWYMAHTFFLREAPKKLGRERKSIVLSTLNIDHMSDEEKRRIAQEVSQALVTRIGRAHD